jgi:hypothetical protein
MCHEAQQELSKYIIQNSPKAFINYRIFKEQIETENYLHTLDDNFFMQNEIGDECHYISSMLFLVFLFFFSLLMSILGLPLSCLQMVYVEHDQAISISFELTVSMSFSSD